MPGEEVEFVEYDDGVNAHEFRRTQVAIDNVPVRQGRNGCDDDQRIHIGRQYFDLTTHVGSRELIAPLADFRNEPVGFIVDRLGPYPVTADRLDSFTLDPGINFVTIGKQ